MSRRPRCSPRRRARPARRLPVRTVRMSPDTTCHESRLPRLADVDAVAPLFDHARFTERLEQGPAFIFIEPGQLGDVGVVELGAGRFAEHRLESFQPVRRVVSGPCATLVMFQADSPENASIVDGVGRRCTKLDRFAGFSSPPFGSVPERSRAERRTLVAGARPAASAAQTAVDVAVYSRPPSARRLARSARTTGPGGRRPSAFAQ